MRSRPLLLLVLSVVCIAGCAEQGIRAGADLHVRPGEKARGPSRHAGVSVPGGMVEPTGVLSLQKALDLALEHSPELKAFSWNVRAAEGARLQAALRPNPKLKVEIEEVGGEGERSGFDGAEGTVEIMQPIELGNKRARRTTLASIEKELAEWDYKAKQFDITREVTGAFVAVLTWQERLALAREVVLIAEQAHNAVSQRVEAGRDSPIEQTKSSVALATARIEPQRAARALESARRRLAATWGATAASFDSVAGEFDKIVPVPASAKLGLLVRYNPDVARWDAEVKRSRAALELEKAQAVSDVTLIGGLQYFNEVDESTMVFGLSIPLAVSDRNQGGIRKATYLLARAEQSGRAAEIKTLAAIEEAAQRLAGAYAEATALKNGVLPGAQSSFDAVSEGYRDGKFDYLQVLDAQRTLFETNGRYLESLAAYHRAKADAGRLIGQSIDSITKTNQDNQ